MPRRKRVSGIEGLAAIMALLAVFCVIQGCAVYMPAGPDPGRLLVSAKSSVTKNLVEQTLEERARLVYKVFGGEEVSDPLWDLRAFVPQPDGSLLPLKPIKPVENVSGYDFEATAEFLAPSGAYPIFILLECSVRHLSLEGQHTVVEYVYLLTWRHQQNLTLCPGCSLELRPFDGRVPRP